MVCTPGTSRVDSWLRNRLELLLLILAVLVPQYLAAQGASIHGWVLGKAAEPPHEAKVILTNKTNRKDKIPIFAKPTGEYGRHQIPPGIYVRRMDSDLAQALLLRVGLNLSWQSDSDGVAEAAPR